MSSSSFVQAPSCRQRAAVRGWFGARGSGSGCVRVTVRGCGVGKVPPSHKVQKSNGEIGEMWGKRLHQHPAGSAHPVHRILTHSISPGRCVEPGAIIHAVTSEVWKGVKNRGKITHRSNGTGGIPLPLHRCVTLPWAPKDFWESSGGSSGAKGWRPQRVHQREKAAGADSHRGVVSAGAGTPQSSCPVLLGRGHAVSLQSAAVALGRVSEA